MIKYLGIQKIDLMTNNPKKIDALKSLGVVVNKRIPLLTNMNKHNKKYIFQKILFFHAFRLTHFKEKLMMHLRYFV